MRVLQLPVVVGVLMRHLQHLQGEGAVQPGGGQASARDHLLQGRCREGVGYAARLPAARAEDGRLPGADRREVLCLLGNKG